MFKKKKYTKKEYKDLSLVYFIISGFLFTGYIIAFLIDGGIDRGIFYSLPLFLFSLITGFSLRAKSKNL